MTCVPVGIVLTWECGDPASAQAPKPLETVIMQRFCSVRSPKVVSCQLTSCNLIYCDTMKCKSGFLHLFFPFR